MSTTFDNVANFAISALATGVNNSTTSWQLADVSAFPSPATRNYRLVIYNATDYAAPHLDPDREVAIATALAGSTFTVIRGQEGTAAVAHNTSGKTYMVYMTPTAGLFQQIMTAINGVENDLANITQDDVPDGTNFKQYSSSDKTKLAGIEAGADVTDAGNVGSSIHGATAKTSIVDADTLAMVDSEASNVLKKITWANFKAAVATYLAPLTQTLTNKTIDGSNNTITNVSLTTAITGTLPVANGGTGNASNTAYAVVCGGTTGTGALQSVSGVGTAGQVLTSNGASALPTWQTPPSSGSLPYTLLGSPTMRTPTFTDNIKYIPICASGVTFTVYNGTAANNTTRRYIGTALQSLVATSLWASITANGLEGIVVHNGYIYIHVINSTTERRIYRADITTDISNTANWTQLTLSGSNFAAANTLTMIGYGNGAFWFADNTNSVYMHATLSGTTLTQQGTVTVTGANYNNGSMVTSQGIAASFSAAPATRLANFSGTLTSGAVLEYGGSNTEWVAIQDVLYAQVSNGFVRQDFP